MIIIPIFLTGIWATIVVLLLVYTCMKIQVPATIGTVFSIATIYFTLLIGGMMGIIYAPWW